MSQPVAALCTGKFQPLEKFFVALCVSDLHRFTEDDFMQMAQVEEAALLRLFLRTKLAIYMSKSNPFGVQQAVEFLPNKETGVLDLTGRVASCRGCTGPDTTSAQLLATIPDAQRALIRKLDLSGCDFFDEDVQCVEHLLHYLPCCHTLILTGNCIFGDWVGCTDSLHRILAMPQVRYVDICTNPIASLDGRNFFRSVSETEWSKLVWVPWQWLHGDTWGVLVSTPTHMDIVKKTHYAYYQEQ